MAKNIRKVRERDFEDRDEMMQAIAALVQAGTPFLWVPKRREKMKEQQKQRMDRVEAVKSFLQGIEGLVTRQWQGKAQMLIEQILEDEDVVEFIAPKRQRGNKLFCEERVMQIIAKLQSKGVYEGKQSVSDRTFARALRMHQYNIYNESDDNLHKGMGNSKRLAPLPSEVEVTIEVVINQNSVSSRGQTP